MRGSTCCRRARESLDYAYMGADGFAGEAFAPTHALACAGERSWSLSVGRMGGQVLGGGVIVLVAVLLWLVYLLPSWQSKMRYNAAERNAVRLGQALRVLAETSEAPEEVHVELTARQTHAQQKLARRVQADQERLAKQ